MDINRYGNVGVAVGEENIISFQLGDSDPWQKKSTSSETEDWGTTPLANNQLFLTAINGCRILARGKDNRLPDEIEAMIEGNRLLPEVLEKQVKILYGKGVMPYKREVIGNKIVRTWEDKKEITNWLESWELIDGVESAQQFAKSVVRRFYYFEDYFVKWRFNRSRIIGVNPIAALELVENKRARLATSKKVDQLNEDVEYKDLNHVFVGNWLGGSFQGMKRYNKLDLSRSLKYPVVISHHKNDAVGQHYGLNKFYEGTKEWIAGANKTATFINSYLKNSFASNVHVIIPAAWLDLKRTMLERICGENEILAEADKPLISFKDKTTGETIELGTTYSEQYLIKYTNMEIKKLSKYMSGPDNQGKLFVSNSFQNEDGKEVRWIIEILDLKRKEYINSLISYDKRADEVLLSSKGIDASITAVSKDGIISKSGSDLYYNYLIYLHNLHTAEETCTEAFNQAIRVHFPKLYNEGYRIGFYNEVPQRQEDVPPADRLENTLNQQTNQMSQIMDKLNEMQNGSN